MLACHLREVRTVMSPSKESKTRRMAVLSIVTALRGWLGTSQAGMGGVQYATFQEEKA